jgi:hypothetical protein
MMQIAVSSATVLHADSYIYNHYDEIVPIVPPYSFERMIQKEDLVNPETGLRPLRFEVIEDVHVGEDYIYIVDSGDGGVFGQVIVLDKDYQFVTNISNIYDESGEQVMVEKVSESGSVSMIQLSLSSGAPTSVYETETGKLYITLQTGQRVVVLDTTTLVENKFGELTFAYIDDFTKPDNLIGATGFEPYKIVVDRAERMYIIVESGREGMLELNSDGSFSRYYGTNPPNVNLLDFFWRQFMSDIQLEQVDRIYAPPFSGVAIDQEGFKYAITNSDDTDQMVYRFNSSGNDVLREMGNTPPIGDVATFSDEGLERSTFVSITVNEFGTYAVLDETKGRIFVYNFDGELLFAFGGLGEETGQFHTPTGIAWDGDKLIVTDLEYRTVTVFKPTDFGEKVLRATEAYHTGKFALAGDLWEEVVVLNSNYEIAYVGIGKKYLLEKDYAKAIEYFELGHNRPYHSMAFEEYRNEQLEEHFLLFASPILFLMGYVIYTEVRYSRKMGE